MKLHRALLQTSFGLFWEETEPWQRVVLVAKLPSESIRHIFLGVPVYLATGFLPISDGLALCSTLAIEDDPEDLFFVQRTHEPSDTELLARFYEQNEIEFHLFDELNRNVTSFKCKITVPPSKAGVLRRVSPLLRKLSDEEILAIFRHLKRVFEQDQTPLKKMELIIVEKETRFFHHVHEPANPPIYDPKRFEEAYHINDEDQGKQLEITLTRMLAALFRRDDLFPSPIIEAAQQTENREFIDLVAVDKTGLLIIEAKARAVTRQSISRKKERRIRSLSKRIHKALRQLRGAYRQALQEKRIVLKTQTETREINLEGLDVHLIVLVSENHPDLGQTDVSTKVVELGRELDVGVHILDLNGLWCLIWRCRGVQELMRLLNRRWKLSSEHNIIKFADEWLA